ncbi:hypothetical protein DFP72DRAFT_1110803, partial [Ephemerocybe angulata]
RSGKSASKWTHSDLTSLDISIESTDPPNYFPFPYPPPLDSLDPPVLNASVWIADPTQGPATSVFLRRLRLSIGTRSEGTVDATTMQMATVLGFESTTGSTVIARFPTPLLMCGEQRVAQTDVCVLSSDGAFLFLPIEDKTIYNKTPSSDVDAQVVAEAIAFFQFNNRSRIEKGKHPLATLNIPCVCMSGTMPTFYTVPVTEELSNIVATSPYAHPNSPVKVLKCDMAPTYSRWNKEQGMADTGFRRVAMEGLVAFKRLADKCALEIAN